MSSSSQPPPSPLRAFGTHRPQRNFEGKIDTRRRRRLRDVARALPRVPGVYFFYGIDDRLLYIGKAKCLRDRVRSYFAETSLPRPPKLRRLLAEIERMEIRRCGSELEALLLERRLIAERLPILNWQHKRFEIYPYLLLSDEAFPRLTLTRAEPVAERFGDDTGGDWLEEGGEEAAVEDDIADVAPPKDYRPPTSATLPLETPPRAGELPGLYLGPFTTPRTAWWTMEAVRNIFPLRSCEGEIVPDPAGRSCFYHDIGRCSGPCVEAVSQLDYRAICEDLVNLLQTGEAPQLDAMKARMEKLADEWRFEEAAKIREQLQAVEMVATRLRRLQRMRAEHNLAIIQPARPFDESPEPIDPTLLPDPKEAANAGSPAPPRAANVFLVQGGVVRRHCVVGNRDGDWMILRAEIQQLFSAPPPTAPFTAKEELDEMMILDRWLQAHGQEGCCAWLNLRPSRQWASNAARKLRKWANATIFELP